MARLLCHRLPVTEFDTSVDRGYNIGRDKHLSIRVTRPSLTRDITNHQLPSQRYTAQSYAGRAVTLNQDLD